MKQTNTNETNNNLSICLDVLLPADEPLLCGALGVVPGGVRPPQLETVLSADWSHSLSKIRSEVLLTSALLCQKDTAY